MSPEYAGEDAGKNAASPSAMPSINLPKGGGAIRGIDEKFAANPVTGTGSLSVSIAVSPGRSGFGPQLSVAYDSGHGKTVLFGGVDVNLNLLGDTWVWDGTNWTQESPQTSPPALSDFNITYDATHNQTIVFGGIDSTGEGTNAVWAFSRAHSFPRSRRW